MPEEDSNNTNSSLVSVILQCTSYISVDQSNVCHLRLYIKDGNIVFHNLLSEEKNLH